MLKDTRRPPWGLCRAGLRLMAAVVLRALWVRAEEPSAFTLGARLGMREVWERCDAGAWEAETRLRMEMSAAARVSEALEAKIAFGTGAEGAPANAEMTWGERVEDRPLRLRVAQIEWTPWPQPPALQVRAGKLEMPFLRPSRLVWDEDVRPEGGVARWRRAGHTLDAFGLIGVFQLAHEAGKERRTLFAAQTGVRNRWPDRHWMMAGAGVYDVDGTAEDSALRPFEAFGAIGLELYFPVQGVLHIAANPKADRAHTAWLTGLSLGRTRAVYGIELSAEWLRIERQALVPAFTDDSYGAGTDRQERRLTVRGRLSRNLLAAVILSRERAPLSSNTGAWRIGLEIQADL